MEYRTKKLFRNHVSVRDLTIKRCIKKKEDLVILYDNKKMTIPFERLKNRFQFHKIKFKSHYDDNKYELIDFPFIEDKESR